MTREYYVGGDVHKDFVTVTVMSPNGKDTEVFEVSATPAGMEQIIKHMGKKKFCYLAETSTYSTDLHNYLVGRRINAFLVDPANLKMITESNKKTDVHDSFVIAQFLRLWRKGEIELSISYIVQDADKYLRDTCMARERYSRLKGDSSRRIHAYMRRSSMYVGDAVLENLDKKSQRDQIRSDFGDDATLMDLMDDYEYALSKTVKIDTELRGLYRRLVKSSKQPIKESNEYDVVKARRMVENINLMASVPGVGMLTAMQLQCMIVDVDRFENADKMRSFFGLSPNVRNSGGKTNHGHITHRGSKFFRTVMYRVATSNLQSRDSDLTEYHRSHVQSLGKMRAKVACANKILDRIFAILKRRTPYRASYSH